MSVRVYIEGGGSTREMQSRCREAFEKLFKNAGFAGKMPRLTACGGRNSAFDDFKTAHKASKGSVAMLVDSEDPVSDAEQTWAHLKKRDGWDRPSGAVDEQVLFMTTCMETWIAFDRAALKRRYGVCLQENALPPAVVHIEKRDRNEVRRALEHATRNCTGPYAKGEVSFRLLAELDPAELLKLPSFARAIRILKANL